MRKVDLQHNVLSEKLTSNAFHVFVARKSSRAVAEFIVTQYSAFGVQSAGPLHGAGVSALPPNAFFVLIAFGVRFTGGWKLPEIIAVIYDHDKTYTRQ